MSDLATPIEKLRPDLKKNEIPSQMPQQMPQHTAPIPQQLNPMLTPPLNTSPTDLRPSMMFPQQEKEKEKLKDDITSSKVVSFFDKNDLKLAVFIAILFISLNSQIVYNQIYKFIPAIYDQMGKVTTLGTMIIGILAALIFILVKKFIL